MARPTTPRYLIRRADPQQYREAILLMDIECFPEDVAPDLHVGIWWLVWHEGKPAGYAGAEVSGSVIALTRSGILPAHRGQGLQPRLIAARLKYARQQGCDVALTYTIDNPPSSNNLIDAGFRMHLPEGHAADTCDWIKHL